MAVLFSNSVEETLAIGECLGRLASPGDFIALTGDLGSGKTHFAQGVARGLGVDPRVCVASPSYTLLNEYNGRIPLYHFDLYRLGGDADILGLGFDEYFYGRGLCLVEWADRLVFEFPDEYLKIVFLCSGDTSRTLELIPCGGRYEKLARELASDCGTDCI